VICWRVIGLLAALAALSPITAIGGVREPVLKQVDLPHSYYWRELYLPQLTTGPSSVSFMPDGLALVYSMSGSLWRQSIDSAEAVELTHAVAAHDFQPDVAPDGRTVVFTRYDGRAMELWWLDLGSGHTHALTTDGQVNLEPRFSPDGRRLAWVSTRDSGHFNLFVADVVDGRLEATRALVAGRRSELERYYYSTYDHAINPSWSPDGRRILYVGNPEVAWGSGDIWSVAVDDSGDRRKILQEETTWSARPELAPDGRRLLYSSYRGRQWHQLWLTTVEGAAPLPLSFGEFDRRGARWSRDGRRIACISNEHGNNSLELIDLPGGRRKTLELQRRVFLGPEPVRLTVDIRDPEGRAVPARVSINGSDGRAQAPDRAWMHADDAFDRSRYVMEPHYFHCVSPCELLVPPGRTDIRVQRGFRYLPWVRTVDIAPGDATRLGVQLVRNDLPPEFGRWLSADLHVHMNYGGHYRNTAERLAAQAQAEDVDVVYNLVVNKEQRVPDVAEFRPGADERAGEAVRLFHAQEFHTSYWGHLGLLHVNELLLPDFSAYRHTALASPYPHNGVIADLAHAQGGLVGYVHPFDWEIKPRDEQSLSNTLPADVALGKVDYLEVVGFSDHKATAAVWYRLLSLGFRVPLGAGTDAMANYASLRGPVGLNRVFLDTGGRSDATALSEALRRGRSFATNGPLLGFSLAGQGPGATIDVGGKKAVDYHIALRSPVPVDHLQLVQDGRVVREFELHGDRRSLDASGQLPVAGSGWVLLRAWNDQSAPEVLDLYPYATTNPIYLEAAEGQRPSPQDAEYFVDWMDRVMADASKRNDYNDDAERVATLAYLQEARDRFLALRRDAETSP